MSSPISGVPDATILSINAHPSRFPVGAFAHHAVLGFCEIVGLPAQFGQRTVCWENHYVDYVQIHTVDVAVEDLQELNEWRKFRGMPATRA